MSWSSRAAALLLLAGLAEALAGCGFRPLYGRNNDGSEVIPEFSQISIAQPDDRTEQLLRNNLLDLLTPRGTPDRPNYLLDYDITEDVGSVLVTRREEIIRSNLRLVVRAELRDYQSGRVVARFSTRSQASFNQTTADYANLIAEKNARDRAMHDIAEQIRIRLANHFDHWRNLAPAQQQDQQLPPAPEMTPRPLLQ